MEDEQKNVQHVQETQYRLAVRPKTAAEAIGISVRTLYTLLKEGRIRSIKVERAVLIPVADLERFVAQRAQADELEEAPL